MSPSPVLDTVMETVMDCVSVNLVWLKLMETFNGS